MIKKAKFIAREAKLKIKYIMEKDCIFCKMVNRDIKAEFIYESERVIALNDINPVAKFHILIIPKKHIDSVLTIDNKDSEDIIDMFKAAKIIVSEKKLDAFRVSFNGGKFQHIPHLHMHLLAGSKIEWSKL